jgi:hypothetical protein
MKLKVDNSKLTDYARGYIDALDNYAVYRDGNRTVGCGVQTYWGAVKEILDSLGLSGAYKEID